MELGCCEQVAPTLPAWLKRLQYVCAAQLGHINTQPASSTTSLQSPGEVGCQAEGAAHETFSSGDQVRVAHMFSHGWKEFPIGNSREERAEASALMFSLFTC